MRKVISTIFISLAIALAISIINFSNGGFISLDKLALDLAINFAFAITITVVNTYYFDTLNRFLSWEIKPLARLITGVLGSVILTMGCLFILITLVRMIVFDQEFSKASSNHGADFYTFGLLITMIVSLIFHAFYFYKELQGRRVKEQKVIAGTATAKFDALKSQLDPHFLFNSLNVLVSLIEENPKAATRFTTSLSKVYRYVLEQRSKELVSIDEELRFARTYVTLLKMRFEDSLIIDIPESSIDAEGMIVPLSLQLLLENAVKHNIVSDQQPLELKVYEENGHLVVQNNLQTKAVVKKSSGVGLQNIASRYALFSDKQMTIQEEEQYFKVNLPIIYKTDTMQATIPAQEANFLKAKDQVKQLKDFYQAVIRSVFLILFLCMLNYFTSDFPWAVFPTLAISFGLTMHYLRTFDNNFFLGRSWEEKKIERLMNDKNF